MSPAPRARRLCRGAHDYDITAGDGPACRACGSLKYHRVSTDPDVGPPFGYADLPGRVNGTPYTETVMRWWQDRRAAPHPKLVAVDRALREELPPWEMGWRVAIHDDVTDLPNHLIQSGALPCPSSPRPRPSLVPRDTPSGPANR